MGDTEFYHAWKESTKAKKANQLAESDTTGFTKHTEYHYSTTVDGDRLDWWPSTRRWMYRGKVTYGKHDALRGFIRNRTRRAS